MDPGLATVIGSVLIALATICGPIIEARTKIYLATLKKDDHRLPSKLTMVLKVSPGPVSPVLFVLAVVAVFVYIPFVSDYAFWYMAAAYISAATGYGATIKMTIDSR
jgi:hypothetical protein